MFLLHLRYKVATYGTTYDMYPLCESLPVTPTSASCDRLMVCIDPVTYSSSTASRIAPPLSDHYP